VSQNRAAVHAVALCAFDLLELEGYDTRRMPIEERKGALAKLLGGAQDGNAFSEHYSGEGAIFLSASSDWHTYATQTCRRKCDLHIASRQR
jgi:ATP-dependent DNA ligase